jgi:hypothetical protein
MLRSQKFIKDGGMAGLVTFDSWMFLASFRDLRERLLARGVFQSLIHVGWNCFPDVHTYHRGVAFVWRPTSNRALGCFVNLSDVQATVDKRALLISRLRTNKGVHWQSSDSFMLISGCPIAYWLNSLQIFSLPPLGETFVSGGRLKTHNGTLYLRFEWEVSRNSSRWKRVMKGGDYRKHAGNHEYIVDWSESAIAFYQSKGGMSPESFRGSEGITWSKVTSDGQPR